MNFSATVKKVSPSIAKVFRFDKHDNIVNTGTGFLYKKRGLLVTCNHVVAAADTIKCRFPGDEKFYSAQIVMDDLEHDLALLKVDVSRQPLVAPKAQSEKDICEGMPVLFSGYPLNLDALTTHQGILSAVTTDAVGSKIYLIDGTVNSGNSGCPLMNEKGEVLGVVNAKRREKADLLDRVEKLQLGAISLHGIDLVEIYQALISNVQLGIGYAVPASYIPEHRGETEPSSMNSPAKPKSKKQQDKKGQ